VKCSPHSVTDEPGNRDRRRGKPGHPCRVADAGCAAKAWVEPRDKGCPLETAPCHPIGARDEEDRQIEQDYQGEQTQGQVEVEAPPPESAGHRMNQAGKVLRWRLLRTRVPGVDIITGASLARCRVILSPADRQNPALATNVNGARYKLTPKSCPTRDDDWRLACDQRRVQLFV